MVAYKTKTLKSEKPYGKLHYTEDGGYTVCGEKVDSPLWIVKSNIHLKITCKECLKKMVICEHAIKCVFDCDREYPRHDEPHVKTIFCRSEKCLKSKLIVECKKL